MKRLLTVTLTLVLSVFATGCTEEALTTAPDQVASIEKSGGEGTLSKDRMIPRILLGNVDLCEAMGRDAGCAAHFSQAGKVGGFASPLFGLATAPSGTILVADAGAGIAAIQGDASTTLIPLPGVTGIGPIGTRSMWATTGAGGDPTSDTGQALYRISRNNTRLTVNLFAFEEAYDPDGGEVPDSNPFDVASLGSRSALVVDAGGNDLLRVDHQGHVEVLAVFPDELVSTENLQQLLGCPEPIIPDLAFICEIPMMPAEAVPTSVAVGPDGYYYVGELKGFPAPTGASNIWRVSPGASWAQCGSSPDCVKVFDGGFTSIIDLAFDANGALHVAELDELSWIALEIFGSGAGGSISSCDLGTLTCGGTAAGIPILTAITFGHDGSLWATENALIPGLAAVVEISGPTGVAQNP